MNLLINQKSVLNTDADSDYNHAITNTAMYYWF